MKNLNYAFISSYIMTKTLFGKKLLLIATITVLITGLTLAATLDDAEAKKPNPKTKPFKGTFSGSFTTSVAGAIVTSTATSSGIYSHLGSSTSAGTFVVDLATFGDPAPGCVDVSPSTSTTTAANGDDVTFDLGKESGIQCFFDSTGAVATSLAFCGAATNIHTSTVVTDYDITGGDGRFVGAAGSGTVSSAINHCAPNGDTFTGTLSGDIKYAASNKS